MMQILLGIPLETGLAVALVLAVVVAVLLVIPTPFRQTLRGIAVIRSRRLKNQVTTPIERELELVAGPLQVIDESHVQVQDLRGSLQHESIVLLQRRDDLAEAEAQYYKAADDHSDSGIDELVLLVADREQEVKIQQGVVDGIQTAVAAACSGVDKARKELRHVQMTIKSDEAKAKATLALDAATHVMEAARSITANGGALKQASGEVNHDFEQAKARLNDMKGTAAERELRELGERQQLDEMRQRLDAKRAAKTDPTAGTASITGTTSGPADQPANAAASPAPAQSQS
jgi:hypothetical protein